MLHSGLGLVQGIVERRNTVPILGHVLLEPDGTSLTPGRHRPRSRNPHRDSVPRRQRKQPDAQRAQTFRNRARDRRRRSRVQVARQRLGRAQVRAGEIQNDGARSAQLPGDAQSEHRQNRRASGPKKQSRPTWRFPPACWRTMIDKTIFAVSPDEARYNLGGVLVEATSPGVGPDGRDGRPSARDDRARRPRDSDAGRRDHSAKGSRRIAQDARPGGRGASASDASKGSSRSSSAARPKSRCAWSRANSPTTAA